MASRARVQLQFAILTAAALAVSPVGSVARAQYHEPMPGFDPHGYETSAAPITQFGGGSYFSQDLGTVLRLRYNTKGYGQERRGNFDIGTFQAINFDDSIAFFDGQVTLNDVQGVGFNLGIGYRWLSIVPYSFEPERVMGLSVWADGTSTEAGNFFPQVGVSYESLGEMWDLRVNSYIPVGASRQVGDFVRTGEIDFQGNFLSQITEAVVDRSLYAGELEVARRLGVHRDAWAFAGPYFLANDEVDTAGYKVGLRGYAYPDLLLQFAVTGDEIYKTTGTFSLVWFVGRTRTDFRPACGVLDRFREPVMRNDYVALAHDTEIGGIPLTDPEGNVLRFVHVNSEAPAGGDGTFENPLHDLAEIHPNSMIGDIVLAHAESEFVGQGPAQLRDDQRLLGEGDGMVFTVDTRERGTVEIPETSPGARGATRPLILDALGDAILLANNNEVTNLDIEGGNRGLVAGAASTGNLFLHDLTIADTTGSAMRFNGITEEVTITEVMVTGGTGFALDFVDVEETAIVLVDNFDYDGGALAAGGIRLEDFDGEFTLQESSLTGGTLDGVAILGASGGDLLFDDTNTLNAIGGTAFRVDGGAANFTGILTVAHDIANATGRSVSIRRVTGVDTQVTFTGDIIDTGQGLLVDSNSGGQILFAGDLTLSTMSDPAIALMNNAGANVDFSGLLDINTTSGTGFFADNGGSIAVLNPNNSITTTTGMIASITGSEIAPVGVTFGEVNRTMAAATNAILVQDNTGGPIVFGDPLASAGDSGTIVGGTAHAILIENTANVAVSGLRIDQTAGVAGVRVIKTTAGTQTVDLNDLEINDGDVGIDVSGGGGPLNMTVNDTDIMASSSVGMRYQDVDSGTIAVNNVSIDGDNTTATAGLQIVDSDASFTFDANSEIRRVDGTAFELSGGAGTITMNADITNTTGDSVHVHDVTGGSLTMFGAVNDTGSGVTIADNTGGDLNLLGSYDLNTDADDAVVVTNNTGANVSFSDLEIQTTSGTGFTATGGGNLTVTGTNTIATTTGTGLEIRDMNILGQAAFESVTVDGAVNGIILENVTGGPVIVSGDALGTANSGGTLNTTGDAVQITDVENVALNRLRVQNAGGRGLAVSHTNAADHGMDVTFQGLNLLASAGTGVDVAAAKNDIDLEFGLRFIDSNLSENVDIAVAGSADFGLLVENTNIDTSATGDIAFSLAFSGNARNGDLTFRDGNTFEAGDAQALFVDTSGANSKSIRMLVEDSEFLNSSAAQAAADIRSRGNTLFHATIRGNTFDNALAGSDFDILASGAQARMRLNLGGDDPQEFNVAAGTGEFNLTTEMGADFRIFERDETIAGNRNMGDVVLDPPDPNEFPNMPTPPTLPTFP